MDEIEKVILYTELKGTTCQLNHGSWECDAPYAVDYLVIPIGYKESDIVEVQARELTIPICEDCREALAEDDGTWLLFICTCCGSSAWKIRELMNQEYPEGILQPMKYCPKCYVETD